MGGCCSCNSGKTNNMVIDPSKAPQKASNNDAKKENHNSNNNEIVRVRSNTIDMLEALSPEQHEDLSAVALIILQKLENRIENNKRTKSEASLAAENSSEFSLNLSSDDDDDDDNNNDNNNNNVKVEPVIRADSVPNLNSYALGFVESTDSFTGDFDDDSDNEDKFANLAERFSYMNNKTMEVDQVTDYAHGILLKRQNTGHHTRVQSVLEVITAKEYQINQAYVNKEHAQNGALDEESYTELMKRLREIRRLIEQEESEVVDKLVQSPTIRKSIGYLTNRQSWLSTPRLNKSFDFDNNDQDDDSNLMPPPSESDSNNNSPKKVRKKKKILKKHKSKASTMKRHSTMKAKTRDSNAVMHSKSVNIPVIKKKKKKKKIISNATIKLSDKKKKTVSPNKTNTAKKVKKQELDKNKNATVSSPSPVKSKSKASSPSPVKSKSKASSPSPVKSKSKASSPSPVKSKSKASSPSPVKSKSKASSPSPVKSKLKSSKLKSSNSPGAVNKSSSPSSKLSSKNVVNDKKSNDKANNSPPKKMIRKKKRIIGGSISIMEKERAKARVLLKRRVNSKRSNEEKNAEVVNVKVGEAGVERVTSDEIVENEVEPGSIHIELE